MNDEANKEAEVYSQHKMSMDAIGFAFVLLEAQKPALKAFIDAEIASHSYLHITDPTFYKKLSTSHGVAQQVKLARAALAFLNEVSIVRDEVAQAQGLQP